MRKIIGLTGAAGGCLLLSSCVTYPYDSAFNSCEREANDCYRVCEDIPDENGYVRCQSHCDRDIDRCFDQAYSPYNSGYGYGYGGGYGYGSPWYGRYGSWYPDSGYFLSFNYYDRYGYRKRKHRPGRDWNDHHPPGGGGYHPPGGGGGGGGGGGYHPPGSGSGNNNPPNSGPREIDRPRTPNRYRQRSSPPISGPSAAPNSGGSSAPPTYSPPPRPVSPPSGGSQPGYTPPASPPPTYNPPPDRPRDAERGSPNRSRTGERQERDLD